MPAKKPRKKPKPGPKNAPHRFGFFRVPERRHVCGVSHLKVDRWCTDATNPGGTEANEPFRLWPEA